MMLKKFATATVITLGFVGAAAPAAPAAFGGKGQQWPADWTQETLKSSFNKGQMSDLLGH